MKKFFSIGNVSNRVFGLDLLRFIAIFMVLLGHGKMVLPPDVKKLFDPFLLDGVAIFFVLSGYLIGGILIKQLERDKPTIGGLVHFWKRRWMRTLPAYLVVLGIIIVYTLVFYYDKFPSDIWKYFLFAQNLINERNHFFAESWSLSIEEWFYLTIPTLLFAVIYFFKLRVKLAVALTSVVVLTLITYYRFSVYHSYGFEDKVKKEALIMKTGKTGESQQIFSTDLDNADKKIVLASFKKQAEKWNWTILPTSNKNVFRFKGKMSAMLGAKVDTLLPFEGKYKLYQNGKKCQLAYVFYFDKDFYDAKKMKYVKEHLNTLNVKAYLPEFETFLEKNLEYQVLPRLDAILFGVIAAFFAFYFPEIWNNKWNFVAAVAGFFLLYYTKRHMGASHEEYAVVWFPFFKSLAVLLVIPFMANWKKGLGHFTSWVTFFSIISYSMYLLNLNVVLNMSIKNIIHGNWKGKSWNELTPSEQALNPLPPSFYKGKHIVSENWEWDYVLFWVLTIFFSFLLYKLVEVPFMNLRDKSKKFGAH